MQSKMRILGWTAYGLRCPDHDINLCEEGDSVYSVSLIQMPNGTGKTTTLNLLRATISGSASSERNPWSSEYIKQFQSRTHSSRTGYFEVRLNLDQQRTTIRLEFDFNSGKITYKTNRGDGLKSGFKPPQKFRSFMNRNFANFYIFNGELAQNLLNPEFADAEQVVEHLFHLTTLKNISSQVDSYWNHKTKDKSAKNKKGKTQRQNTRDSISERLDQAKEKQKECLADVKLYEKVLREQKQQYDVGLTKHKKLNKSLKEARAELEKTKMDVKEKSTQALNLMAAPHSLNFQFAKQIFELKESLDRVKLPESAAREFFEELSEEELCICGRPIDAHTRIEINKRASTYLGSDDVALLNTIKSSISDAVGHSLVDTEIELNEELKDLRELQQLKRRADQNVNRLEGEAEGTDPEIQAARDMMEHAKGKLRSAKSKLDRYSETEDITDDVSKILSVPILKQKLKKAEDDLADITGTLEIKRKREIIKSIINDAHKSARSSIANDVCVDANNRIQKMMPNNRIVIEKIDKSLVLKGQAGGSSGEQLSTAYAFLATLFNRSQHELPFVLDSPANQIDLAIRPQIGELVPKLGAQFIGFTISTERQGFVPSIVAASNKQVQFLTLFRKNSPEIEVNARKAGVKSETEDGIVVEDEVFFNNFHLVEEEDANAF